VIPGEEGTSEPLLGIESVIWFKLAEILILSVTALLVFLLVVKPLIRRLTTPPGAHAEGAGATALPGAQGTPAIAQATTSPGAAAQIGAAPIQTALPKRESMIDVSQIEGQVRESAVRKIGDVVQAHPEEAMAIVRTWLHQPA
jgi:flagellar M-ring protein FliF